MQFPKQVKKSAKPKLDSMRGGRRWETAYVTLPDGSEITGWYDKYRIDSVNFYFEHEGQWYRAPIEPFDTGEVRGRISPDLRLNESEEESEDEPQMNFPSQVQKVKMPDVSVGGENRWIPCPVILPDGTETLGYYDELKKGTIDTKVFYFELSGQGYECPILPFEKGVTGGVISIDLRDPAFANRFKVSPEVAASFGPSDEDKAQMYEAFCSMGLGEPDSISFRECKVAWHKLNPGKRLEPNNDGLNLEGSWFKEGALF